MVPTTSPIDHDVVGPVPAAPPAPLAPVDDATVRSPAEEARTLAAGTTIASLATLTDDGYPWASMVTFATLADGSPILYVSTLAEHGRNLERDDRASVVVVADAGDGDPLDSGRVTLAGRVHRAEEAELELARAAYFAAIPGSEILTGFGDFTMWVLTVERVRWVGGYGRMDSADAAAYAAAEPDPVAPGAAHAIAHLNEDHADALLLIAQVLGGHPDATAAEAVRVDRYGLDVLARTPRGDAPARIGFTERLDEPDALRAATVELVKRARAAQG